MRFNNREPDWLGKSRVEVRDGQEVITGETAKFAARALATIGTNWKTDLYVPEFDRESLLKLQAYLDKKPSTPMIEKLRMELASASLHLRRITERENLADEFFPEGLDAIKIKQGQRGTCYLLAPLIKLHTMPELFWALLPEVIKKTGKDSCLVKFPSAKRLFGDAYPDIREMTDYKAETTSWTSMNGTVGAMGDIAIESRYSSMVAAGKLGMESHTMRINAKGETPVDGGISNMALASLFPQEWVRTHRDVRLQLYAAENFKDLVNNPRELLFYAINTNACDTMRVGELDIFTRHAFAIGEIKNDKLRLYNPHDPSKEIWVPYKDLRIPNHATLNMVSLSYHATPLMDHARMIHDLPSEDYKIRYLQNLMYTSRYRLRELLMISDKANIAQAFEEFLRDPTFGDLFRKAKLDEFVQAHQVHATYPFSGFTMPQEKPKKKPNIPARIGATALFGAVLSCAGVALHHEPTCLPSVPGTWTFKSGVDVLAEHHGENDTVIYSVNFKGTAVEYVVNYPIECLSGQASHGVAAYKPVRRDYVQISDQEGHVTGMYGFRPSISTEQQNDLSKETNSTNFKFKSSGGFSVICYGSEEKPSLQGCVDDVAKWNVW